MIMITILRRLGSMRRRGRFALSCTIRTIQSNTIQYSIAAPVALGNLRHNGCPARSVAPARRDSARAGDARAPAIAGPAPDDESAGSAPKRTKERDWDIITHTMVGTHGHLRERRPRARRVRRIRSQTHKRAPGWRPRVGIKSEYQPVLKYYIILYYIISYHIVNLE